jgi:hypothetical protein
MHVACSVLPKGPLMRPVFGYCEDQVALAYGSTVEFAGWLLQRDELVSVQTSSSSSSSSSSSMDVPSHPVGIRRDCTI